MYTDFEALLHEAEVQYLRKPGMIAFQQAVSALDQRLATYECLRDQELTIFQAIADQLVATFAQEKTERLEMALKHWMAVMRYAAMAMLLHNPEFLQHRVLEWLTDLVQVHQMQAIEAKLYQFLTVQLQQVLTEPQWMLVQPLLAQAQAALVGDCGDAEEQPVSVGALHR